MAYTLKELTNAEKEIITHLKLFCICENKNCPVCKKKDKFKVVASSKIWDCHNCGKKLKIEIVCLLPKNH